VDAILAAFEPPYPERTVTRGVQVEVRPPQVNSFTHAQTMTEHEGQQQPVTLALPTKAGRRINQTAGFIRREILTNMRTFAANLTI
jgi:hypothetical protein